MTHQFAKRISLTKGFLSFVAGSMAIAIPLAVTSHAQVAANPAHERGDIAGDWQGTLEMGRSTRVVVRIAKAEKGWGARMFLLLDQGSRSINASAVAFDGSILKYSVDPMGASYSGALSPDGNSFVGTFTGGPQPQPLTLERATKETAWEIPAPIPPPKLMAADADPSFEVATIKPNDSGAASMQRLTMNGRNFTIRNGSLLDLIGFSYEVQAKQIVGGPDWMGKDRFDIDAVPDKEGAPNPQQIRTMIQKLLKQRFNLTFHPDKRELSAYVLTVGKGGQKLTPTQITGPLPGIGMRPGTSGLTLNMINATVSDFTGFLQTLVLDRPVVDRTGITGRFDYHVTFTPDDSQFNGHPPPLPARPDGDATEAAPGLFEAMPQQLGLKFDAEKTAVDVIAIDHVDKPSAN